MCKYAYGLTYIHIPYYICTHIKFYIQGYIPAAAPRACRLLPHRPRFRKRWRARRRERWAGPSLPIGAKRSEGKTLYTHTYTCIHIYIYIRLYICICILTGAHSRKCTYMYLPTYAAMHFLCLPVLREPHACAFSTFHVSASLCATLFLPKSCTKHVCLDHGRGSLCI